VLIELVIKGVSNITTSRSGADLNSSVKNLSGEVELHEVLEDAKDDYLAPWKSSNQELNQNVELSGIGELMDESEYSRRDQSKTGVEVHQTKNLEEERLMIHVFHYELALFSSYCLDLS
jgi:hypothetical protein